MSRKAAIIQPVDPLPTAVDLCGDGCLSIPRAARFCGLGVRMFQQLLTVGRIETLRVGKRRVVPKRGLARFLAVRLAEELEGTR